MQARRPPLSRAQKRTGVAKSAQGISRFFIQNIYLPHRNLAFPLLLQRKLK
jgi:hypothetical protein